MDCCILCLQIIKSIKSRLNIFEKDAADDNIEQIIKTHFWIEPDINKHTFICKKCWEALHSFHKFYIRIKEAHELLENVANVQCAATGEPVKRRRGRPPKKPATEVPAENDKSDDCEDKEMVLLAEVKLEDTLGEHAETEFMNLFCNIGDDPSTNTTSNEQPLQEMSIKEENSAEHMAVDDPFDDCSSLSVNSDEEENEQTKTNDEFIVKNFNLICPLCSERMQDFIALKQHCREKHNTRGYALCCGKKLLKRCVLVDHIQLHLDPKYFKCTLCDEVFSDRRSLEKHKDNHDDDDDNKKCVFKCSTCAKSFLRRCVYERHILLHLPAEQKTVQCPKCGKIYANKYIMNHHLKSVHLNLHAMNDPDDTEESEKVIKKNTCKAKTASSSSSTDDFIAQNFNLICPLCSESMQTFAALKQHCRQKHNTRGYALCCSKKLLKRCVLVDHIQFHLDPKYFKCTRCDKVLCDRRSLEKHEENHDDKKERVFECPTCSKSFFRRCVYERHILLHLPAEQKTVKCPKCEKTFANKYFMNQHLKLVHLNIYAKVCDVCGKMIRGRAAMERHKEEHEGLEHSSIQCEQCGITLSNKYGLARHIKVQHTAKNMQPQVCPICSKISPHLSAHQRHMQYMHHMQRKHACPMCDKAFRRATELKEHMATHTGEVLYTCPHCPKTFNSNANMYAHRKKAHAKEWEESRQSRYNVKKSLKTEKSVLALALATTVAGGVSISNKLDTTQDH